MRKALDSKALSQSPPPMTVAEFLDWPGDGTGRRFELVDGELRAMSPGSPTHGTIQGTLSRLIGNVLIDAGGLFRVVGETGVITGVHSHMNMRIPDVAISGTPDSPDRAARPRRADRDPLTKQCLGYLGQCVGYHHIPSVQETAVVHSTRVLAEVLRRDAQGDWPAEPERIGPDGTLSLDSIGFACPLRDAYAQTHLA